MNRPITSAADFWMRLGTRVLPFADVATKELPLGRLLRLSLFQVSVGIAAVLLTGTLNRVMIVELAVPGWIVALMVSLPLVFAPLRALIGFKSDTHKSVLGWKRVPYVWVGTMLQYGGFAIMPFALLILGGGGHGPVWIGTFGAAFAFLLVGAGMHMAQTAGLALATDLATPENRSKVVALLYVMLLVGMMFSSLVLGVLLIDFSAMRLIQVIQGAAVVTLVLNVVALWKQEARNPENTRGNVDGRRFADAWRTLVASRSARRLLIAVGLGAAAFSMQDVLLEPYGGEILNLSVAATTALTAAWALGTLFGFLIAKIQLDRGLDPHRVAGFGVVSGVGAFSLVILAAITESTLLFPVGVLLIGTGGGLFAVGTMVAAMMLCRDGYSGLVVGAWGAVQATCAGLGIALGGALRDVVSSAALHGSYGPVLVTPITGYVSVYLIEISLLFATLIAIGPLARFTADETPKGQGLELAQFPS
jgi:BCD family chlorophyll transporter-like MFS transporter